MFFRYGGCSKETYYDRLSKTINTLIHESIQFCNFLIGQEAVKISFSLKLLFISQICHDDEF